MVNTSPRVGIMSAGDMGSGFGSVLHAQGLEVYTCLAGRSDFTRLRAGEAGFIDSPDLDHLVSHVDLFLSVLVPSEATRLAKDIAAAMKRTGSTPVYADLNAIAPNTVLEIENIVRGAGAAFVDGGIIGGPPRQGYSPHIAVSGPDIEALEVLRRPRPRYPRHRSEHRSGIRAQDGLRRIDQGHHSPLDRAPHRRQGHGALRRADGRIRRQQRRLQGPGSAPSR